MRALRTVNTDTSTYFGTPLNYVSSTCESDGYSISGASGNTPPLIRMGTMQLFNKTLLYDKDGRFAGTFQATYFQDAPTGLPMGSALVLRLRNKPEASVVLFHGERRVITVNTPTKLNLLSAGSLLA